MMQRIATISIILHGIKKKKWAHTNVHNRKKTRLSSITMSTTNANRTNPQMSSNNPPNKHPKKKQPQRKSLNEYEQTLQKNAVFQQQFSFGFF